MNSTSPLTSSTSDTLEKIKIAQFPLLALPFYGAPVICKIRELNQAQIMECGDFSMIETFADKIRKSIKPRRRDVVQYSQIMHNIARAALVEPTYDKIIAVIGCGPDFENEKRKLKDLQEKIASIANGPMRQSLEEEIDSFMVKINLLLPSDFLAALTSYVLGLHKSDIKMLTEEMLYNAACLAQLGHDNPHDHIAGRFTDFNKYDIDVRAWGIKAEKEKEDKTESVEV